MVEGPDIPDRAPDRTTPLGRYLWRTTGPMAILAVLSVPSLFVPLVEAPGEAQEPWWLGLRALFSLVFAVDLGIRFRLTPRPERRRFLRANLVDVFAVAVPVLRLVRLGRLIRGLFSLGHLRSFFAAAVTVAFTAAVLAYVLEQGAPGSSIRNLGDAFWWAMATCTTVGYGDVVPVTVGGRLTGLVLMIVGITTFSLVTAQLATRFLHSDRGGGPSVQRLDELDARLARVEAAQQALGGAHDREE